MLLKTEPTIFELYLINIIFSFPFHIGGALSFFFKQNTFHNFSHRLQSIILCHTCSIVFLPVLSALSSLYLSFTSVILQPIRFSVRTIDRVNRPTDFDRKYRSSKLNGRKSVAKAYAARINVPCTLFPSTFPSINIIFS